MVLRYPAVGDNDAGRYSISDGRKNGRVIPYAEDGLPNGDAIFLFRRSVSSGVGKFLHRLLFWAAIGVSEPKLCTVEIWQVEK